MQTCAVRRNGAQYDRYNVGDSTYDGYKPISKKTDMGQPTPCQGKKHTVGCTYWTKQYPGTEWSGNTAPFGGCNWQPTCKLLTYNRANISKCCTGEYNNNAFCDKGWCPFASECTPYMTPVCEAIDDNGKLPMDSAFVPDAYRFQDVQRHCIDWCAQTRKPDNTGQCDILKHNYCTNPKNFRWGALETDVCKEYCSRVGTNCDSALTQYCATLKDPLNHDVCSCFMGDAFYDTYFDEITKRYNFTAAPKYKHCYFGRCATSNIKPYLTKEGKEPCPDVFQCVQVTNIENNGTISGPIEIIQDTKCQQIINEGGLTEKKYSCRSSDEKCVEDSSGTLSLDQCNKDCGAVPGGPKYSCQNGTCATDPAGTYGTLANCQQACRVSTKYKCDNGTCVSDASGTFTSLSACQNSCAEESWWGKNWIWILFIGLVVVGGVIIFFVFRSKEPKASRKE
jgi:hypothetical protein